ncbi:MAG: hypothetical protein LBN30_04995 [Oscillospiraceae bacterium]|jgi:hypothetical protein|nr:hypothetical protein [Oscillospiraceae bacterium]
MKKAVLTIAIILSAVIALFGCGSPRNKSVPIDAYLLRELSNLATTIDVSDYNISAEEFDKVINDFLENNTDIFYIGNAYEYTQIDDAVDVVTLQYTDTPENIKVRYRQIREGIELSVYELLYSELSAYADEIDLSAYKIPPSDMELLFKGFLSVHTKLYYVDSELEFVYSNGIVGVIYPHYISDKVPPPQPTDSPTPPPSEQPQSSEAPPPTQKPPAPETLTLEELLVREIESYAKSIDISSYAIYESELSDVYFGFMDEHPELFYAQGRVSYSEDSSGKITIVYPFYSAEPDVITVQRREFEAAVDAAVAAIPVGLTDAEKVVAVSDYLCVNATYDLTYEHRFAYDILVLGIGVCNGYADAYNVILSRLGIESFKLISIGMNHAWTMVKINGEWYHCDATWNDPTPDVGNVYHSYILLPDDVMSDNRHNHYGWVETAPPADDYTYVDAYWITESSPINFG